MGKRRERRTAIGGQFAPRLIELLASPPYRVLSLSAHRVLDRIEIELGNHGGTENGHLPVTFDNFVVYGIHRHSIAKAIRELVALGFVEITEHGRAGNAEYRSPNKFRLTYRPTKYGEPTHEWRRITSLDAAIARAKEAREPQETKNKIPVPENASFGDEIRH